MEEDLREVRDLRGIKVGSKQKYTAEYGRELVPLPGFGTDWHPLSLAQFCLRYLSSLPEVQLEAVFRVLSSHEAKHGSFERDLERLSDHDVGEARELKLGKLSKEHVEGVSNEWKKMRQSAARIGLGGFARIVFGSPLYTALA